MVSKEEQNIGVEKEIVEIPTENGNDKKQDNQKKGKSSKKMAIILLAVLIFIVIVAFFVYRYIKEDNQKEEKKKSIVNTQKEYKSEYKMTGNDIQDFDLYFLQLESAKKNAIYSPLSIKYALAMLQDGAENDTKAQISNLIGDYKTKKYTNSANMSLANALFVKDTMKKEVKTDYAQKINNKYGAEVVYDDFKDATNVNNWISKNTLNLLNNVVDDSTVSNLDLILVNSLAIDMDWNYKLQHEVSDSKVAQRLYTVSYIHEDYSDYVPSIGNSSETFKSILFNGKSQVKAAQIGATINNYDIIKELGEDNIRKFIEEKYREYLKNPGCGEETTEEAIKNYVDNYVKDINKNYKQVDYSTDFQFYTDSNVKVFAKDLKTYDNTTLQYVGIMPTTMTLDEYIKSINSKDISKLISNLKSLELSSFEYGKIYRITGYIPFFKYDYELHLKEDLKKLGITDVFDSKKANLSNISSKNEYIEKAIHKANIDFSNEGIKAAATTVMGGIGSTSCGFDYNYKVPVETIDLTFDKPFMYIIRDKSTGEVWFTGSVYEPQI
ncbi:MAG: serpin family protein [bacterium]|nr:serpin family protein [bacterium]